MSDRHQIGYWSLISQLSDIPAGHETYPGMVHPDEQEQAKVTMLDSSVVGGASSIGGGVCVTDQSTLTGQRIRVKASTAVRGGGGLVEKASTVELRASEIMGNRATEGGGFCLRDEARLSLWEETEVHHNTAENQGGGLMVISDSRADLHHAVMTANVAFYGAALFVDGCDVTMDRVRIVHNTVVGGSKRIATSLWEIFHKTENVRMPSHMAAQTFSIGAFGVKFNFRKSILRR